MPNGACLTRVAASQVADLIASAFNVQAHHRAEPNPQRAGHVAVSSKTEVTNCQSGFESWLSCSVLVPSPPKGAGPNSVYSRNGPHQQPKNQPNPRRAELRHGAFCGILSAVRLGLQWPSVFSSAEGGAFISGFGLGAAQPGRRAAAQGGGGAANFAQLLGGRGPLGLPEAIGQKGQIGQKIVCCGQLGAASSRQDEPIERRPEEQGIQDAHKKQLRRYGYSLQWPLKPPPF
jgi:hypothetical protein